MDKYLAMCFGLYGARYASFQQGFDLMLQPGEVLPPRDNMLCLSAVKLSF